MIGQKERTMGELCRVCDGYGIRTDATTHGHWVTAEGVEQEEEVPLCESCLRAGNPCGPGYQEVS